MITVPACSESTPAAPGSSSGDGDSPQGDGDEPEGDGDGDGDQPSGDGDGDRDGPAQGDGDDPDGGGPAGDGDAPGPFPPVTELSKPGPFAADTVNNSGPNNNYTIFQPKELGKDGLKHPIITWGNGGSTTPSWYGLLPQLATHGFVVIACNTIPSIGSEVQLGKDLKAGIDWMIAENGREGSPYKGKLDTTKISSTGYSMGSLGTFTIVDDPRLTTTLHISGGNMGNNQAIVEKMHAPAAFLCGENDIADPNCLSDFEALSDDQPVFYGTFLGGEHLTILGADAVAERLRSACVGWLRWQLMNDQTWKKMFVGSDCTLCTDKANWVTRQNALK